MNDHEHRPSIPARLLAVLSVPTALASFLYVACGVGFYRAPWGYTIAWLTLIASLAYGLPMLDTTIDTCAIIWHRTKRAACHVRRALADGHANHHASASMRPVRVVRGCGKGQAANTK
ncbi:hypothetical protein [Bifidobacterium criceti]|uniref:Uncharacterized protein n=1 Tax=Bifidobacterium criceti TaxID=1960969 RepID=A0A2A2ED93_9BIFI|nr:hypothetical protein [Bifidobacterium criceti]PAU67194.1 hypothetical protein B1526_1278 [Bifidobacterium criceti]